ncbi:MAG: Gfo/Idh/MocA family oxidoreductase [Bacteroidota bacterium]
MNIAFIGAGDISLLHAKGIEACPDAQLVGLWNITSSLAEEKSKLYQCRIYPSAEALVSDPEVDAVFVLTNLETHHRYVCMALEAGKHVFVEKPVGVTFAEIREMQALADKAGVMCMPGHNYIYEAGIQRARELIESGKLGQLVSLYIMYNIHHPEEVAARYPGVIRQILTHHAYISLYLAGKPREVSAMKSVIHYEEISQEDIAMVTFKMENGALVHWCASFASDDHAGDPWTMMVKMIGTKGATRYSYRDWVENTPATVHSQTYSAYPYTIANIDRYFVEECLGKGKQPLSTLEDAAVAQQIIEAIEQSIEEGRHITIH